MKSEEKGGDWKGPDIPEECAEFERVLARIARELANVREEYFDGTLTECLQILAEFLGFDRSTVMMFSQHAELLSVSHCWAREGMRKVAAGTIIDADSWYTHQIRLGHITKISNIADLPPEAAQERDFVTESGLKSTISIPLMSEETIVGAVAFGTFHSEMHWPSEVVWRLRLVGEILGMALLRHRTAIGLQTLFQTVDQMSPAGLGAVLWPKNYRRRFAVDLIRMEHQERIRVSDALHEDVMQTLFGLGMLVERMAEAGPSHRSALVFRIRQLVQGALKQLRTLTMDLRSETLRKRGLLQELRQLAEQMLEIYGLSVEFKADEGVEPVNADTQVFLQHASRQLLDNIAAHSQSSRASMHVQRINAEQVRLAVADYGAGFDISRLEDMPSNTFGLFSIREQAALLGGDLELQSSSGNGTRVIVTVPG